METRKDENQDIVIFNLKISKKIFQALKKYWQILTISLAITATAGVILFFVKHG